MQASEHEAANISDKEDVGTASAKSIYNAGYTNQFLLRPKAYDRVYDISFCSRQRYEFLTALDFLELSTEKSWRGQKIE